MNLLIPAAGRSSRFPGVRPKWMLTHPNGNLMIVEAITALNLESIDRIYVTILKEHDKKFNAVQALDRAFKKIGLADKLEIVVLLHPTNSQPETIYETLKHRKIDGPIFIKDSDNRFKVKIEKRNAVSVCSLSGQGKINAANKSYVTLDDQGLINNIVEKKIISETFCVGGYSFESANSFVSYYEKLKSESGLYISHIIYSMLLDGVPFSMQECTDYLDWGTLEDWNKYRSEFLTLFIDLDGVLVKNSSEYFDPLWGSTSGIIENVNSINELYESGKAKIIITTARSKDYEVETKQQCRKIGLMYHDIIFDLFHSRRIIINDYANSNPYPTCLALNVERNSNNLRSLLTGVK